MRLTLAPVLHLVAEALDLGHAIVDKIPDRDLEIAKARLELRKHRSDQRHERAMARISGR